MYLFGLRQRKISSNILKLIPMRFVLFQCTVVTVYLNCYCMQKGKHNLV
uniref:Uncharacterized protein n=1 Tax=Anguilla anguilla TaxID=7936 RepID=A0A0E9RLB5_ANGAN